MRILITAGPTREPIDPVRYISNRSSGKMGYAIARAALERGHQVVLVSGPVALPPPEDCEFHQVETARQMYQEVEQEISGCHVAICCAAVADYRVAKVSSQKIKKTSNTMTLELEKTEDILGSCRNKFRFRGILVGFAAETQNVEENARDKMERKGCDLIVANDVSKTNVGFDSNDNHITIFSKDATPKTFSRQSKSRLGERIVDLIESY